MKIGILRSQLTHFIPFADNCLPSNWQSPQNTPNNQITVDSGSVCPIAFSIYMSTVFPEGKQLSHAAECDTVLLPLGIPRSFCLLWCVSRVVFRRFFVCVLFLVHSLVFRPECALCGWSSLRYKRILFVRRLSQMNSAHRERKKAPANIPWDIQTMRAVIKRLP